MESKIAFNGLNSRKQGVIGLKKNKTSLVGKIVKIGVIVLLVAAVGFGGFYAYGQWQMNQRRTAMASQFSTTRLVEQVTESPISETVSATGTVALRDEQSVYSDTTAKISEVMVSEGDRVTNGQVIVK